MQELLPNIYLLPANDHAGFGYSQFVKLESGNLAFPRLKDGSASDCFSWIEEQGGVTHVLVSDRHFAGAGCLELAEEFSAKLICSDVEAKASAKRCKVPHPLELAEHKLRADLLAIPTPGHTPGQFSYLVNMGDTTVLFTGDFIRFRDHEVIPGNKNLVKIGDSIRNLANYDFDLILSCTDYDEALSYRQVEDKSRLIETCLAECY